MEDILETLDDGVMLLTSANDAPLMTAAKTYPDWQVALIGILTVFVGLICIILICKLFGMIFSGVSDSKKEDAPAVSAAPALSKEERGAVVAAVAAAIAEDLGTDVSALRIHSFRQL